MHNVDQVGFILAKPVPYYPLLGLGRTLDNLESLSLRCGKDDDTLLGTSGFGFYQILVVVICHHQTAICFKKSLRKDS
jgi:hypothetical protein